MLQVLGQAEALAAVMNSTFAIHPGSIILAPVIAITFQLPRKWACASYQTRAAYPPRLLP